MPGPIKFDALLGPSYTMFSAKAEIQRAVNTYRQRVESGQGAGPYVLLKSPGLVPQFQPSGGAGVFRGAVELNNQVLAVIDDTLYNLDSPTHVNFTYAAKLVNDGKPVSFALSASTAMIVSGGVLYRANAGVLTKPAITFTPVDIQYIGSYFVAPSTTTAFYFNTDDGLTWPAANVQNLQESANNILHSTVHLGALYLYGSKITAAYVVGSNPNQPFNVQTSGQIPFGATAAPTQGSIGNFRYWLGHDKDGQGTVYRAQGYAVQRISTLAVEEKIRQYARDFGIDDAFGMTFRLGGQEFYRVTFPAADATWELNCSITEATGQPEWEEPLAWDYLNGIYHRHRANTIFFGFGKVLVGDQSNGWLYEMTPDAYTDWGFPIRWLRRSPHIVQDDQWVNYDNLVLGAETGVGLAVPLWLHTYDRNRATFVANLATQVGLGNVTAAQSTVLQSIYDIQPYIPLNPYPTPDTMNGLGFTPWGGSVTLADNVTSLGQPPQIGMQYSNNGGKSFTQPLYRSLGLPGDDIRVKWDRGGMARDRVYQLSGDAPCKLALTSAWFGPEELAS